VQVEDLIQAGMIGLLEVSTKYDASKGASFETYAGIRIRGAMLDEVRKGTGRLVRFTATRAWSATQFARLKLKPAVTLKITKLRPNSN
jgi:RNA polymerase sigma factor (sigma-70 family)